MEHVCEIGRYKVIEYTGGGYLSFGGNMVEREISLTASMVSDETWTKKILLAFAGQGITYKVCPICGKSVDWNKVCAFLASYLIQRGKDLTGKAKKD